MEYLEIIAALGIVAYAVIEMRHGRAVDTEIRDRVLELDARTQWQAHEAEREREQVAARVGHVVDLIERLDARLDAVETRCAVLDERTRAKDDEVSEDD